MVVLIESGVHLFGHNRVDAMWPGGDRRAALRHRNFEGHQRVEAPTSVLESEKKNNQKFAENVA